MFPGLPVDMFCKILFRKWELEQWRRGYRPGVHCARGCPALRYWRRKKVYLSAILDFIMAEIYLSALLDFIMA